MERNGEGQTRALVQVMEEGDSGVKMLKWVWGYSFIGRVLTSQFPSTDRPSMVVNIIPVPERQRQENQEFKVIKVILRSA